jgi:hypothetical protein
MNVYIVESKVRQGLRELRRARARAIAGIALAVALALVAVAGIALSVGSAAADPVAVAFVAVVAAICFALWGGRAMSSMARLEQRIVRAVAAAADRAAPRPPTA